MRDAWQVAAYAQSEWTLCFAQSEPIYIFHDNTGALFNMKIIFKVRIPNWMVRRSEYHPMTKVGIALSVRQCVYIIMAIVKLR